MEFLLRTVQQESYPVEWKYLQQRAENPNTKLPQPSLVRNLRLVFTNEHPLIRMRHRIQNAEDMTDEARCPILMPAKHHLTSLIVMDVHTKLLHVGSTQATLNELRASGIWIVKGLSTVKHILRTHCLPCKRAKGGHYPTPPYPQLPAERITAAAPFERVGLDYFGPVYFRYGAPGPSNKGWVLLITCMVTRAIHMELVTSMNTTAFLKAFTRFANRRGTPTHVFSDNGSSFLMAREILRNHTDRPSSSTTDDRQWRLFDDATIADFMATNHIRDWGTITQKSSWQGGLYERLIGPVKLAMRTTIGGKITLLFDELQTLITGIEAQINNRPLTYVPGEADNPIVIRPSDIICPNRQTGFLTYTVHDDALDPLYDYSSDKSYQEVLKTLSRVENLKRKFFERFVKEYVPYLCTRSITPFKDGRITARDTPAVGHVVLVKDIDTKRGNWPLGLVTAVHESEYDGEHRSASVRVAPTNRTVDRPVSWLYPLEIPPAPTSSPVPEEQQLPVNSEQKAEEEQKNTSQPETTPNYYQYTAPPVPQTRRTSARLALRPARDWSHLALVLCIMASIFLPAAAACELDHIPKAARIIYTEHCWNSGRLIFELPTKQLCSAIATCSGKRLIQPDGSCDDTCPVCPSWATHCVPWGGFSTILNEDTRETPMVTGVCSFVPGRPKCSKNPQNGTFSMFQTIDGRTHVVDELHVTVKEAQVPTYRCVDRYAHPRALFVDPAKISDKKTGTDEYCRENHCSVAGKHYCFRENRHMAYATDEFGQEKQINAWGTIDKQFYPFANPTSFTKCPRCRASCTKFGLGINSSKEIDLLEVCYRAPEAICRRFQRPKLLETVLLPVEVALQHHTSSVSHWVNGIQQSNITVECRATPICTLINCFWCSFHWKNPRCYNGYSWTVIALAVTASWTIVFLILLGIIQRLFPDRPASRCFRKQRVTNQYSARVNMATSEVSLDTETGPKKRKNRKYKFPRIPFGLNKGPQLLETALQPLDETGMTEVPSRSPSLRIKAYTAQPLIPLMCVLFITTSHLTSACTTPTTLTASNQLCSIENNKLTCTINQATRLAILPEETTCLVVMDGKGRPLGQVQVQLLSIEAACNKQSLYWTRAFHSKVHGIKRCPGSGSCTGSICEKINRDSKIDELKGEANDNLGFSYCEESCGCASCGCFWCSSGCLFYRTFVVPTSDVIYELFKCPSYDYRIRLRITVKLDNKGELTTTEVLSPGGHVQWNQIRMSIISLTEPIVPLMSTTFLTDSARTATVDASPPGSPITGTIGQLQCENKEKADNISQCHLPVDGCVCNARQDAVGWLYLQRN